MPNDVGLSDNRVFHDFVWALQGYTWAPVTQAVRSDQDYAEYRRVVCGWPVDAVSAHEQTYCVAREQLSRARGCGTDAAKLDVDDLSKESAAEPWLRLARADVDAIFSDRRWESVAPSCHWWNAVFLDPVSGGPRGFGKPACHIEAPVALYWDSAEPQAKLEWLRLELVPVGPKVGNLNVQLCPSAFTALQVFLGDREPDKCWWTALDRARDAALAQYLLAARREESQALLRGSFVVRWHLKIDLRDVRTALYSAGIQGSSHGAAFATALVKLLAKGHQILARP